MTPLRAARAATAVLAMAAVGARAAHAGGPLAVRVATPACTEAPAFEAFLASLRAELAGHDPTCCTVEDPDAPMHSGAVTLAIEPCDGNGREAVITVGDDARARTISRVIPLADVQPSARPRALALAAAETVRALGLTPGSPSAAAPPSVRAAASADVDVRLYPSLHTTLLGGRAGVETRRSRWYARLEAGGSAGRRDFGAGDVTVRQLDAGASAGPRLAVGRAVLDLGLTAEAGWAWIDGQSSLAEVLVGSGSGFVGAVSARAALEGPSFWKVRLVGVAQAGQVLRGISGTVDGTPSAGVSGPFFVIGVGIAGP